MFLNREDAARQLAERLRGHQLRRPLVLGIPRGGVVVGAAIAQQLGAELDVVLSRKLRSPHEPELAAGAIAEDGHVYLNPEAEEILELHGDAFHAERERQLAEIDRRRRLIRQIRPAAEIAGRTVIVTDDGIATGATMLAALQTLRAKEPHNLIVAVPVGAPDRLRRIRPECDELICLLAPENFFAIGQFYDDFSEIDDERMMAVLRDAVREGAPIAP